MDRTSRYVVGVGVRGEIGKNRYNVVKLRRVSVRLPEEGAKRYPSGEDSEWSEVRQMSDDLWIRKEGSFHEFTSGDTFESSGRLICSVFRKTHTVVFSYFERKTHVL